MTFRNLFFAYALTACGAVTSTDPGDLTDPADLADLANPRDPVTICSAACAFGCNAETGQCNECVADTVACRDGAVETCGRDGLVATVESCTLGCVDADASHLARCGHIVPVSIEGVCESLASEPGFVSPTGTLTLDTNVDATCSGGVIAQLGGPAICVVRATTITLHDVKVKGARPIAFVADAALDVVGLLDVSADGALPGPAGGTRVSGQAMDAGGGGGGAGFRQVGGLGGGSGEFGIGSGAAGGAFDPLAQPFTGGARSAAFRGTTPPLLPLGGFFPQPGAGGGGLMLVACRGAVTVGGTIDAGGGGGSGGGDISPNSTVNLYGGAAGGSGGYVVLQGAQVVVTGKVFAGGGGGGGGCSTDNCTGVSGQDGLGPTSTGDGGRGTGGGTAGGAGGTGERVPGNGINSSSSTSPGGGGGSAGRIQVFVPAGVTPALTPTIAEPAFESNRTIATR